MNITETGFYKTRIGQKVEILAIIPKAKFPIIGELQGNYGTYTWKDNGSYRGLGGNSYDIIGKWEDPVVHTGYLNVYVDKLGSIFPDRPLEVTDKIGTLKIKVDMSKPKGQRIWEDEN